MFQRFLALAAALAACIVPAGRVAAQSVVSEEAVEPPVQITPAPSAPALAAYDALPTEIYQSVLRIENAAQAYDYRAPWNGGRFGGGTGTGFVVGPNRILTNAHVVSNSRRLLLRKHDEPGVFPARILHIAHDCDLALLELEDPAPLEGVPQLQLGEVPALESVVRVVGYPVGGEKLSLTRGVVSRIDFNIYSHTGIDQHLVVQIDAAINPGNSGGPVLQGDKVVGVAFQGLRSADNTGYMIPTPVIKRFLADIEDGSYDHYVDLAFADFELVNPAQRAALGLADDQRGILVTRVSPGGSADGKLEDGDILMAIDDHPVFSNGQVRIDGQLVNMHEIVERKFRGDTVKLSFLRDGKPGEEVVTLSRFDPAVMLATEYETRPAYAVFAGLVFQPFSRNLLAAYRFDSLTVRHFLANWVNEALYEEWEDVVMLTNVLPDEVNAGMAGLGGLIVDTINGEKVRSMEDLERLLFAPMDNGGLPEFIEIRCIDFDRPLILEGARVAAAHDRILDRYGVPSDRVVHADGESSW